MQEKQESKQKKLLKVAKKTIADLNAKIESLITERSAVNVELARYMSVRGQLRKRIRTYEDVISQNNLWSYFRRNKDKTASRNTDRDMFIKAANTFARKEP